jgi:hypothetical protein
MTCIERLALTGLVLLPLAAVGCEKTDSLGDRDPSIDPETRPLTSPPAMHETNKEMERGNEPSTNAKTAVAGATSEAITKITEARCAREMRCENIGVDKKYSSLDECSSEVRKEWREDLDSRECSGGVVQKELSECLEEIRNEDCGNPFDTLGRLAACREGDICKAMVN